jgi:hypothetical protein
MVVKIDNKNGDFGGFVTWPFRQFGNSGVDQEYLGRGCAYSSPTAAWKLWPPGGKSTSSSLQGSFHSSRCFTAGTHEPWDRHTNNDNLLVSLFNKFVQSTSVVYSRL